MAKTTYVDTPDELKKLSRNAIERSDRFVLGVSQAHKALPSDARKKELKELSMFRFLSPIWREFTPEQKAIWKTAGAYSNMSGWQLFTSDSAARIRNDLAFGDYPSNLWQVNAGYVQIESPATELVLQQAHPQQYLVAQKVPGAPWKKQIVALTETFSLPLLLAIRYKSNLTPTGPTQRARYYADVWTSYQARDIHSEYSVHFDASSDWQLDSVSVSTLPGIILGYTLYLEIVGYTGTLLFDNISAVHGGTNWARDPRCDDVEKVFTKAFAAIPPFWVPVSLPAGASFVSDYPPALA